VFRELYKRLMTWHTFFFVLIGAAVIVFLFYLDRHNRMSHVIQSFGMLGTIVAILFMTILCMTPIPSEGLLIMYLRIYGVGFGVFYSWLGSTLSTLIIYIIVKHYGRPIMKKVVSIDRFEQVNGWVERHGSVGLLAARLLPIPAFVVNYAAGLMPAVRFWSYMWTGVVSIMPYYIGVAFLYAGVLSNRLWLFVGLVPLCIIGLASFAVRRYSARTRNFEN
jgi:uncharacterized membrane protein YdjX (TVP38/TMEM64 family)